DDPVGVPPPDRGEPRVEPGRGLGHPPDPYVVRQPPGQSAQQFVLVLGPNLSRKIDMRDLAPGVDARVRTAGDRQLVRLLGPGHGPVRGRELPLHGALTLTLLGPAGEVLAVVRQAQPHPYETGLNLVTHRVFPLRMRDGPAPGKGRARH